MNEKDFVERLILAYKAYPFPNISIEHFIEWVHRQYGLAEPEVKKYERSRTEV